MKTAISLPDTLFEKADALAKNLGINRSQLYTRALQVYIARFDQEAITAKLNDLYEDQSASLDPILNNMQMVSISDSRQETDW